MENKEFISVVDCNSLAPYNETDFACDGGFYNCPDCEEQQYISESYDGLKTECDKCYKEHIFQRID